MPAPETAPRSRREAEGPKSGSVGGESSRENAKRGAGRRHIYLFVSDGFQCPVRMNSCRNHGGNTRGRCRPPCCSPSKESAAMSHSPPPLSPDLKVFFRVAATAWLNHAFCRVRRCRRDGQCLARLAANGEVQCFRQMKNADVDEMMNFLANTVELSTPDRLAASLARAKTQEEREMIEFRYWLFRHYHSEMVKAGLRSVTPERQ